MAIIQGTIDIDILTGTADDDEIYGLQGHDDLYGGDGNDLLVGGLGDDLLDGEGGVDVMDGGDGNDTYYVDDSGDTIVETAADGDTDIVQVSVNYFDLGSAYVEQVYFIELGSATLLGSDGNNLLNTSTGNDWIEGRGGNDWLLGGGGDDHLEGGTGNDELDGWLGNDTMIGGTGDDVYNVDSASDVVTEYAGEGTDTVKVRKASYTLLTNFENADLRYFSGAISVTGNSANNVFIMGTGAQSVAGSTGIDTVSYAYTSAVTVDLLNQTFAGEATDDYMTGIENLTGSAYDDVLRTLGTASVIDGGPGADTMEGRAGGDIYFVDNAGDVVIEVAGGGTDEVRVRNLPSYTLTGYVEKLTNITNFVFTGTGNGLANEMNGGTTGDTFYGGAGADTLNGNDGDDLLYGEGDHDVLNGGSGIDAMAGGLGNDTYIVDGSQDTVTEQMNEGIDQVLVSLASYTLTNYVENLTFNGSGNFQGTGNSLGNVMTGGDGDDTLNGLGGPDNLYGGLGNDTLNAGDGEDTVIGGEGADILSGGGGNDVYRFSSASETGTGAGADRIVDFAWFYDKVDLRGIDADSGTAGDQAFSFIGTAAFSGVAGQLRYAFDGTDTWLQADRDGDGVADLEIVFTGNHTLAASDFYL